MFLLYILIIALAAYGMWKMADRIITTDRLRSMESIVNGDIEKAKKAKEIFQKKRQLRAMKKEVMHEKEKFELEEEKDKLERDLSEMMK